MAVETNRYKNVVINYHKMENVIQNDDLGTTNKHNFSTKDFVYVDFFN